MKNKGAILFGILGILVFIFLGFIYSLNNNQQNNNNQVTIQEENVISAQEEEGNTVPAQKEEIVKSDDKDIKERFKATEIVFNNLPESIEFWTEAYCPGSGTDYDYEIDDDMWDYYLASCERGETGSHGGCSSCIMSKIKLVKDQHTYVNFRQSVKFEDSVGIYIERLVGNNEEESCEVRVWKSGEVKKIFPSYYVSREYGNNIFCSNVESKDLNYDGYNDLIFHGRSEGTSDGAQFDYVFLYNPIEKDVDWENQIIFQAWHTPYYIINEGKEYNSGVTCRMRIYKEEKLFKDDLPCPSVISSTLEE